MGWWLDGRRMGGRGGSGGGMGVYRRRRGGLWDVGCRAWRCGCVLGSCVEVGYERAVVGVGGRGGSSPRPWDYETSALPTELWRMLLCVDG